MTDDAQSERVERRLVGEFDEHVHLSASTAWIHSSKVVDYLRRAVELGCSVLGMDGARIHEGKIYPDLDLIFDGNPLDYWADELPVEDELFFDVMLECSEA